MSAVEHCENCGRGIGKLEQPFVWKAHVVCAECHARLTAAAPSAAAAPAHRPLTAPPPLPLRQHYHPRVAPHDAPAPAPVAHRPAAPVSQPAPTLLCAACGHAYPFAEVVSDHGKVICRTCARAVAGQNADRAASDGGSRSLKLLAAGAAAVVVFGAVGVGTYFLVRSRTNRTVAVASQSAPRVADATAPEVAARASKPEAAPQPVPPTADAGEPRATGPSTLFPTPDPTGASAPTANATPLTASASLAPSPPSVAIATTQSAAPFTGATAVAPDVRKPTPPAGNPDAKINTTPAPAAAPAVPPEGTTERFVYDGRALLAQGKFQQGLDLFNQALKQERNNADAWHGSGLCYQGLGNRDVAVERLEKAVTLYDPPSRAAVYNCAAANLRDNPMRAAKLVKDYLARDPGGQDEAMHTLLGRAMFGANRQARQNKYYAEVQEFYFGYMEKVNATRTDGRKRWGGEWVPGPVATERWNRYRGLWQNVEKLRVVVDHDTKAKTDAWDRFNDLRNAFRLKGEVELKQAKDRYEAAAKQEIASRQQLKAAEAEFNSAEKPPFPQIVKPIPMDPMSPGALIGN